MPLERKPSASAQFNRKFILPTLRPDRVAHLGLGTRGTQPNPFTHRYRKDTFLVTASETRAYVFEVETHRLLAEIHHGDSITAVTFTPDGRYLITGSLDHNVRIVRTADWRQTHTLQLRELVFAVTTSADSKYIGTGSLDNTARVFEVSSGKEVLILPADSAVTTIAFSRDGRYFASGGDDKTARLYETSSGELIARIELNDQIKLVKFSPDGRFLTTHDWANGVGLYSTQNGTPVAKLEQTKALDFSPDGRWLAAAGADGKARLLDMSGPQGTLYLDNSGPVYAVALSRDRRFAAVSADGVRVFALPTGQLAGEVQSEEQSTNIALSPDGRYVAVALAEKALGVFEVDSGKVVARLPHPDSIDAIAFTPDGQSIVTSDDDRNLRIFDVPGSKPPRVIPNVLSLDTLAITHDGKSLLLRLDKIAQVVEFNSGALLARFEQSSKIFSAAISPDGKFLATGNDDRSMRLYDVSKRKEVHQMSDFGAVSAVDFSSDGQYIAIGSTDTSAAVLEAATAKKVARWDCSGEVREVAFSSDDKYVICATIQRSNSSVVIVHRNLWRTEDLIEAACAGVGRNFWHWEWRHYFGDRPYRLTCPTLPDPEST